MGCRPIRPKSSHESGVLEQPSSQLLEDNKCNDLVGLSRVSSVSMVRDLPIETPEIVEVTVAAWGTIEEIYRAQWASLVRLASVLTTDRARAEDIVHDVFVRFAARPLPQDAPSYLRQMVVNSARDHYRRVRSSTVCARRASIGRDPRSGRDHHPCPEASGSPAPGTGTALLRRSECRSDRRATGLSERDGEVPPPSGDRGTEKGAGNMRPSYTEVEGRLAVFIPRFVADIPDHPPVGLVHVQRCASTAKPSSAAHPRHCGLGRVDFPGDRLVGIAVGGCSIPRRRGSQGHNARH